MTEPRTPSSPDDAGEAFFTRRDFLSRAGRAGVALSIAAPGFNRAWLTDVASLGGSSSGALSAEQQQLAALHGGFRWRML